MSREALLQEIERCWPLAQARWSRFLLLSAPIDDAAHPSIARIHLGTRQIALSFAQIIERDLIDCTEAILAHEVGHHVRYPGTLAVQARMRLLERSVLPFEGYSLINLFTDLMINERLGHELKAPLARIYQSFAGEPAFEETWRKDPSFIFYLSIYEALWRLEPGSLLGRASTAFAAAYPDARAEAQVLAQDLFLLGPNVYAQFLYFVSVLSRYIQPLEGELPESADPYACGAAEPSADDWADALRPNAQEAEAIRRALARGWFSPAQAERLGAMSSVEERIAGIPGFGTSDAERVPEVMAAWYRREAELHLVRPPPQRRMGEAIVPTTHEDWEAGDPVREIDWIGTLVQRGERLGAASPLRRAAIAEEEGQEVTLWQPKLEIYLDVSGSMPDPRLSVNAMTLAAQILLAGTIRAGGWVRALLYSSAPVLYWQWCRSEIELSRFLMHYIGAGTEFPFSVLQSSLREPGAPPIRVIITDADFDHNVAPPEHAAVFAAAALASQLILLLHRPNHDRVLAYRAAGAQVIEVAEMDDFPKLAADLTFTLFPEQADAVVQGA